jgi:N-acyl-L-homoserine lactone synthetase
MDEKKKRKLQPLPSFARRLGISAAIMAGMVSLALLAGIMGYHTIAHLGWVDSLLNASMILTGMGPVDPMKDDAAKLFASAYALFSGVVFLSAVGVLLSPILHRILRSFHIDDDGL